MQKFYWPSSCQNGYQDKNMNSSNEYKARKMDKPWQYGNSVEHRNITQETNEAKNMDISSLTRTLPRKSRDQLNMKHSERTNTAQSTYSAAVKVKMLCTSRETMCRILPGGERDSGQGSGEEICSISADIPIRRRHADKVGQGWNQKSKTWNQNTLSHALYECGIGQERRNEKRQSVQSIEFTKHTYENVYDNKNAAREGIENVELAQFKNPLKSDCELQSINRKTPRSCKKPKAGNEVSRSKSCERGKVGTAVLDNMRRLSDRLSSSPDCSMLRQSSTSCSSSTSPPPSILSVAARAIPCMASTGRTSPTGSLAYQSAEQDWQKDPSGPAQSLTHRLRGRLEYVNKKMNLIRSRSAERLRGCTSAVRSEVIAVDQKRTRPVQTDTTCVYSGPFLGQARAVVGCVPSPYDRDALPFNKDDLIDIIDMNAGGLWRGRCGHRVGSFKFVNVEILPTRQRRRSRSRSLRRTKRKPGTLAEVLKVLQMEEHLPVFVLNGYEDLTLFKDLDDEELDYLNITNEYQREKLVAMAELLYPVDAKENGERDADNESDDGNSEAGITDIS